MPTEEWMEKYEGMRDRLTCWTDPDSYFTGNMVGNTAVDAMDIGTVSFPSGRILACDPLIELEDRPPFMQTVSPGTYPVTICVMPSEKYGDRYACVKVTVSDAKPVSGSTGRSASRRMRTSTRTTTCSAICSRRATTRIPAIRGMEGTG